MDSNFTLEFQFYNISGDGCFQQQRHYRRYPYHTIAIFLINVFLCLAALFGNSAILVAIWKNPSLQSTANILLSSLAVTDFFVGLIAQPMLIVLLLTGMYGVPSSSYRFICLGFNYVSHVLCGSSLCIITAIGLDRFLALRLHLRYNSIVTSRLSCERGCIWYLDMPATSYDKYILGISKLLQHDPNSNLCHHSCKLCYLF